MPRSFLIKKHTGKRPVARFSFYSDLSEKQSVEESKVFVQSDRLGPPPEYAPETSLLPTPPSEEPTLEKLWPGNDLDPKPEDLSDSSSREDELDGEEKPYRCQHCSKVFTRSWNFQRHVLIHSGQKPFKCLKCPKAFALAAHLKIHNRIHTGEKPYTCNICCRGFAQLTNLQRHILTHTGEKPHKCTYCPKAFVSSSDLRRHVRIHTGERPYKCKQCSKAFTTSGNLQSHILTHTGVKPYKCQICNWKFISSSNLRTHIRIHHAYYLQQGGEKMITDMLKAKKTVDTSKYVCKEKL